MKITAGGLGNIVLTIILVFALVVIAEQTFAAESEEQIMDGKVDVLYRSEATAPFRDRKEKRSVIFGVTLDQIFFSKFRSKIDGANYENLFGKSPINFIQAELGLKYNFALGGVGASLLLGSGEVSDGRSNEMSTLTVRKKGVNLTYSLDSLFREPYVVPYVSGQLLSWEWTEEAKNPTTKAKRTKSGSTGVTSGYQAGFLIQLNWLDPQAALVARNSSNMNNAYVDLFVSQYAASNGSEDPNFQSDTNYGGGLKLEF